MTRRKTYSTEPDERNEDIMPPVSGDQEPNPPDSVPETTEEPSVVAHDPPPVNVRVPEKRPASPSAPAPAPKKRVRDRPSQKKKLSVAVLCTDPLTQRFI